LPRLLRDLDLEPGEVATLSTPNDLFMQILDLVASGSTGPMPERGLRAAMFGSAIGAAYLSTLPDAEVVRLAERARIPHGEAPQLLREAARARAAGFADGPSPDEATWSLAVPLPPQGFGAPLVLGIAGRPERIQERRDAVYAGMRAAIGRWMRPRGADGAG
jgi:DNA-binding IclR family transcriptional regulator